MKNLLDNEIEKMFQLYFLTSFNNMIEKKGIRKKVLELPESEKVNYSYNIEYTTRNGKIIEKKGKDQFTYKIKDSNDYQRFLQNVELRQLADSIRRNETALKINERNLNLYKFLKKAFTNLDRYTIIIQYIKEYVENQKNENKISKELYQKIQEIDKELGKGNIVSETLLNKIEQFEILSGLGEKIVLNDREEIRKSNILETYYLDKLLGKRKEIKEYKIDKNNNIIEIVFTNGEKIQKKIKGISKIEIDKDRIEQEINKTKEKIKEQKRIIKTDKLKFEKLKKEYKEKAKEININSESQLSKNEELHLLKSYIRNEMQSDMDVSNLDFDKAVDIVMEHEVAINPELYIPKDEAYLKILSDLYIDTPAELATLFLIEANKVSKNSKKTLQTKLREVLKELNMSNSFSDIELKFENNNLIIYNNKTNKIIHDIKILRINQIEVLLLDTIKKEFLKHLKLLGINENNINNLSELQKEHIGNLNINLLDEKYEKLSQLKQDLKEIKQDINIELS